MQVLGLKSAFLESRKITIQKRELIIEEVHTYKRRFLAIFFISRLTNYSLRVLFFGSSHLSVRNFGSSDVIYKHY